MKIDLSVEEAENGFILRIDQKTVLCRNQREIARAIISYMNVASQNPESIPFPSDRSERYKLIKGNSQAFDRRRMVIEKYKKPSKDSAGDDSK